MRTVARPLRRRYRAAVVVGLVLALLGPTAEADAVPVTAVTALSITQDADVSALPHGGGAVVENPAWLSGPTASQFDVFGSRAGLSLDLGAGTVFRSGTTYDLAAVPPSASSYVVRGSLSWCVTAGTLQVLDATVVDGRLTSLAADFNVSGCGSGARGSVRIASAIGFAGAETGQGSTTWGVGIGDVKTSHVTVTAAGGTALTLGTATLQTATASSFALRHDGCSGRTLGAGQSCSIDLSGRGSVAGTFTAVLHLPTPGSSLGQVEFGMLVGVVDPDTGAFHPSAQRLVDTRSGLGAARGAVAGGRGITVDVARAIGRQYAEIGAAVVNLTVTNPTVAGFVTAYPAGTARPGTSSINFLPGQTVANLVTVPVSADGNFQLDNAFGATDLVVDLVGWYGTATSAVARGGGLHPVTPSRLLDTRVGAVGKLLGGHTAELRVAYGGDSGAHVAAVALNITVTNTEAPGYLTAWNDEWHYATTTSTLNFVAGATVANAAVVATSWCPHESCTPGANFAVRNESGRPVDVVVDVVGWYDDGSVPADIRYAPLATPTRVADSRTGLGLARFGAGVTQALSAPSSVSDADTYALDTNVTGLALDADSYISAWPAGSVRPSTSVVNPVRGRVVANHAITAVGAAGAVDYYNFAGRLELVVDVSGTFERFPRSTPVWPPPADTG